MNPTLSICIPTLNRPGFLLQSLNSIFSEPLLLSQLEICISNNCSEADYATVDELLAEHAGKWNIKYVRHAQRLPLDENHHYVKRMATSEYIYFLGDDDFFLRDELCKLLDLIRRKKPDLAIFNGYQVDDASAYLGLHFSLAPNEYDSVEAAFKELKDKGSFGSVLVHRDMLQDADFERLYQTDHAYGCYWLSLFRKHERGEDLRIIVPEFPCVALRAARKTYNHIDVYFNKIPRWMALHQQLLQISGLRHLIDDNAAETARFNTSLRFLMHLRATGYDLFSIQKADPAFYDRHRLRIWLAQRSATLFLYKGLRLMYRCSLKKMTLAEAADSKTHISYKLSSGICKRADERNEQH
jgi:glycosyltransferase involved in cell wall biosynthesis